MNALKNFALIALSLALASCGQSSSGKMEAAEGRSALMSIPSAASFEADSISERPEYLAYEHHYGIKVGQDSLSSGVESLTQKCRADGQQICLLMGVNQNGGEWASANIEMRVVPTSLGAYVELIQSLGEIESQQTSAQDLGASIADNEKRMEMLKSYRDKLIQLEGKADNNIDSLIKLSSELAEVQSKIEAVTGERARLDQRIKMDVLNVRFSVERVEAAWSPLGEAFSEFGQNLAEGTAIFVTTFSYLIPWLIFLVFLFFLIRMIYRKVKK